MPGLYCRHRAVLLVIAAGLLCGVMAVCVIAPQPLLVFAWGVFDRSAKDRWAGGGEIPLPIPEQLADRLGDAHFHWRVLIHRPADGEATVVVCISRSTRAFPEQPDRFFATKGSRQEAGLGDSAVIQIGVPLPWPEFSSAWSRAINGQWRLVRDGAEFPVVSLAAENRIALGLDESWWTKTLAYHYWKPEDGPKPSVKDVW